MEKETISQEEATEKLIEFIESCDGDLLATIFEYAFAAVSNAEYDEENDQIIYDKDPAIEL